MDESILVQVYLTTVQLALDVGLSRSIRVEEVIEVLHAYYDERKKEEDPAFHCTMVYHVEKRQVLQKDWTIEEAGIKMADCLYIF